MDLRMLPTAFSVIALFAQLQLVFCVPVKTTAFDGSLVTSDDFDIYISRDLYNFDGANKHCISYGGNLIKVEKVALNDVIKKYLDDNGYVNKANVWLGADRRGLPSDANNFWWIADKTRVGENNAFTAWAPGQPDNYGSDEECLHYSSTFSFSWNDIYCSDKNFALCEFPKSIDTNAEDVTGNTNGDVTKPSETNAEDVTKPSETNAEDVTNAE